MSLRDKPIDPATQRLAEITEAVRLGAITAAEGIARATAVLDEWGPSAQEPVDAALIDTSVPVPRFPRLCWALRRRSVRRRAVN